MIRAAEAYKNTVNKPKELRLTIEELKDKSKHTRVSTVPGKESVSKTPDLPIRVAPTKYKAPEPDAQDLVMEPDILMVRPEPLSLDPYMEPEPEVQADPDRPTKPEPSWKQNFKKQRGGGRKSKAKPIE